MGNLILADVFMFRGFRDASERQVPEASMSSIIVQDHQGVAPFVPENPGGKGPATSPGERVSSVSRAIHATVGSAEPGTCMGHVSWEFA